MGSAIFTGYGTEFTQLREIYDSSDLGKVARGDRAGIAFVEIETDAPLRIIAIEDDPAATELKRTEVAEHLQMMGIPYCEVKVDYRHGLVAAMNEKRCHD